MRSTLFAALVLVASVAGAAFSAFVHVTPDNQQEHGFDVCINRNYLDMQLTEIRIRGERPLKGGWLITTREYVEPSGQRFREYIWDDSIDDSPIESITELQHDEEAGATRVLMPQEMLSRSYLYFDFPEPVFDGGFFYSIDLSTFAQFDSERC